MFLAKTGILGPFLALGPKGRESAIQTAVFRPGTSLSKIDGCGFPVSLDCDD